MVLGHQQQHCSIVDLHVRGCQQPTSPFKVRLFHVDIPAFTFKKSRCYEVVVKSVCQLRDVSCFSITKLILYFLRRSDTVLEINGTKRNAFMCIDWKKITTNSYRYYIKTGNSLTITVTSRNVLNAMCKISEVF